MSWPRASSWPARAYVYGTWGYALARAREHANERHQRVHLYRSALDGEQVWVASWDPKPTHAASSRPDVESPSVERGQS